MRFRVVGLAAILALVPMLSEASAAEKAPVGRWEQDGGDVALKPKSDAQFVEFTAQQVVENFDTNETKMLHDTKGKLVVVHGRVKSVKKATFSTGDIIELANDERTVNLFMRKDQEENVIKLVPKMPVDVACESLQTWFGSIAGQSCLVVKKAK